MNMHAHIMARHAEAGIFDNPTMSNLLIALLVLVAVGLLVSMVLLFLRYRRRQNERRESLPQHERPTSSRSNHRRLVIRPESSYVQQEKEAFLASTDAPTPTSPVPEIRVTLPEEPDRSGRPQSGRVVVVHVGDTSVGYAPYDQKLPAYQENESDRFQSLDLDRIGGLREKEYR